MTVEVNIVYREKTAAMVVPSEAVSGNAVQIVNDGTIRRVPVTVGIRGSRNVEISGDVSKGATVLSPARTDLADGTRVHVENVSTKPAADAPLDVTPEPSPAPTSAPTSNPVSAPALASAREPAAVAINAADADNAVISSAITAHVDSVVNDARRNVGKYTATR